jgi:alkylated DNA nucleotide flippase Atl1
MRFGRGKNAKEEVGTVTYRGSAYLAGNPSDARQAVSAKHCLAS